MLWMPNNTNLAIITGQLVVGGAERQLFLWLSHLDRAKYNIVVLSLHPGHGDYWEERVRGLDVPLLFVPPRRNKLFRLFDVTAKLRPHRPDLIHGWHLFASPYAGGASKLLRTKASLGSLRGSFESFRSSRCGSMLRWLVAGMVVNSQAAARQLQQHRSTKKCPVYVVPNAVEDRNLPRKEVRAQLSRTWKIPDERFWFGSVGRFAPTKNFDVLIDIAGALRKRGVDIHLILIGDGQMAGQLKARTAQLNLQDRVTFTGELPNAGEIVSGFDAFCFPSSDEGLPNVIMEAAVARVPVVAWQSEFMADLLEHKASALLAPPGDVEAMGRWVLTLVEQPELGLALGAAARETIRTKFGLKEMISKMDAVYDDILKGPNQTRNSPLSLSTEAPTV